MQDNSRKKNTHDHLNLYGGAFDLPAKFIVYDNQEFTCMYQWMLITSYTHSSYSYHANKLKLLLSKLLRFFSLSKTFPYFLYFSSSTIRVDGGCPTLLCLFLSFLLHPKIVHGTAELKENKQLRTIEGEGRVGMKASSEKGRVG